MVDLIAKQVDFLMSGLITIDNEPLSNGKVYFWANGGKTEPKDVFADDTQTQVLSQPIRLDAKGQAKVYADGSYYIEVLDTADVVQATYEGVRYSASSIADGLATDALTDFGSSSELIQNGLDDLDPATEYTLLFQAGAYTFNDNITFPANVTCRFEPGAEVTIAAGRVASFMGDISAEQYRVFYGGGSIEVIDDAVPLQLSYWTGIDAGYLDHLKITNDLEVKGDANVTGKVQAGSFALDLNTEINEVSIDGSLMGNSDTALPTERAVKTYVDSFIRKVVSHIAGENITAGMPVRLDPSDNTKVLLCNAATPEGAIFYGMANESVVTDQSVNVSLDTFDTGESGYVKGDVIYLDDTAGNVIINQPVKDCLDTSSTTGENYVTNPVAIGYIYDDSDPEHVSMALKGVYGVQIQGNSWDRAVISNTTCYDIDTSVPSTYLVKNTDGSGGWHANIPGDADAGGLVNFKFNLNKYIELIRRGENRALEITQIAMFGSALDEDSDNGWQYRVGVLKDGAAVLSPTQFNGDTYGAAISKYAAGSVHIDLNSDYVFQFGFDNYYMDWNGESRVTIEWGHVVIVDHSHMAGLRSADAYMANEEGGHTHDSRYYTEAEIIALLADKSDTSHDHNTVYYTQAEVDAAITAAAGSITGTVDAIEGDISTSSTVTTACLALSALDTVDWREKKDTSWYNTCGKFPKDAAIVANTASTRTYIEIYDLQHQDNVQWNPSMELEVNTIIFEHMVFLDGALYAAGANLDLYKFDFIADKVYRWTETAYQVAGGNISDFNGTGWITLNTTQVLANGYCNNLFVKALSGAPTDAFGRKIPTILVPNGSATTVLKDDGTAHDVIGAAEAATLIGDVLAIRNGTEISFGALPISDSSVAAWRTGYFDNSDTDMGYILTPNTNIIGLDDKLYIPAEDGLSVVHEISDMAVDKEMLTEITKYFNTGVRFGDNLVAAICGNDDTDGNTQAGPDLIPVITGGGSVVDDWVVGGQTSNVNCVWVDPFYRITQSGTGTSTVTRSFSVTTGLKYKFSLMETSSTGDSGANGSCMKLTGAASWNSPSHYTPVGKRVSHEFIAATDTLTVQFYNSSASSKQRWDLILSAISSTDKSPNFLTFNYVGTVTREFFPNSDIAYMTSFSDTAYCYATIGAAGANTIAYGFAKVTNTSDDQMLMLIDNGGQSTDQPANGLYIAANNGTLKVNAGGLVTSKAGIIPEGKWFHFLIAKTPTDIKYYIDGVLVHTHTDSNSDITDTVMTLGSGVLDASPQGLAMVKVSRGIITADQVKYIYEMDRKVIHSKSTFECVPNQISVDEDKKEIQLASTTGLVRINDVIDVTTNDGEAFDLATDDENVVMTEIKDIVQLAITAAGVFVHNPELNLR